MSLVELLVVIGILVLLIGMTSIGLQSGLAARKFAQHVVEIREALTTAREEAATRGRPVRVTLWNDFASGSNQPRLRLSTELVDAAGQAASGTATRPPLNKEGVCWLDAEDQILGGSTVLYFQPDGQLIPPNGEQAPFQMKLSAVAGAKPLENLTGMLRIGPVSEISFHDSRPAQD